MKRTLLLTITMVMAACTASDTTPTPGRGDGAAVVRVLDGDSLIVDLDGSETEVRLLGINAPERGECFDGEARARLAELAGDRVRLTGEDEDRFGRLLRYALDEGGLVINQQLVAEGFALALTTDHTLVDEFKLAESEAFTARVGRWQSDACGPEASPGPIIRDLEHDAPGNDAANANGEWIEIANLGAAAADLTGWGVQDESSSHRFRFPNGFILAPGERVRIFSGCGMPGHGNEALYWCDGDPVWSNRGDTAYLLDKAGNVVDRWAF